MMHQPRIRSRRLLDEQDRTARQPMSDQDAPGRIPVEVLEMQMAQFGMHARFNVEGLNVNVLKDLKRRGIDLRPPKEPRPRIPAAPTVKLPRVSERIEQMRRQGWVRPADMAALLGAKQITLEQFARNGKLKSIAVGNRILYRAEELAMYRRGHGTSRRIVLPDGQEFESIKACAVAHGIDCGTLKSRLHKMGLKSDGPGIAAALALKTARKRRAA
jgi:hypothetical protein